MALPGWMMRIAVALAFCLAFAGCHSVPTTVVRGVAPDDEFDHLRAAALLVDRGQIAPAIPHLKAHLKLHPDAPMIRAYLAELLLKTGHDAEARTHYEMFVREAGGQDGLAKHHLVHAHTKLMEIAAESDDTFREQFHRGAALLHLANEGDA
jgi:thioredoxin-like negative regulator of GroEL